MHRRCHLRRTGRLVRLWTQKPSRDRREVVASDREREQRRELARVQMGLLADIEDYRTDGVCEDYTVVPVTLTRGVW